MTLGHREAFGSMTKPFHAGKAAANGVLAARLAARRISPASPTRWATRECSTIFADAAVDGELFRPWTSDWELERNAFKPYPCGIVAHPAIDAAIEAGAAITDPAAIEAGRGALPPAGPRADGHVQPADGLQARFSARHGVAVGLLDGRVGLAAVLRRPRDATGRVAAARPDEPAYPPLLRPGRGHDHGATAPAADDVEVHVAHARGSLARPLTDAELDAKVDALVEPVLGAGVAATDPPRVEDIDTPTGFADLVAAARPRMEHAHDTHRRHGRRSSVTATPPEAALPLAADHLDAMGAALRRDGAAVEARASRWLAHCDEPRVAGGTRRAARRRPPAGPSSRPPSLPCNEDSADRAEARRDARRRRHRSGRVGRRRADRGDVRRTLERPRDRGPDRGGRRRRAAAAISTRPECATSSDCAPPRPRDCAPRRVPKPVWCRPPRPPPTPWRPRPWRATDSLRRRTDLGGRRGLFALLAPGATPQARLRAGRQDLGSSTMTQTDSVNTGPAAAVDESEPAAEAFRAVDVADRAGRPRRSSLRRSASSRSSTRPDLHMFGKKGVPGPGFFPIALSVAVIALGLLLVAVSVAARRPRTAAGPRARCAVSVRNCCARRACGWAS